MAINVLYLGYWSACDPLTQAVIVPRLRILSQQEEIGKIIFCSIERNGKSEFIDLPKVKWIGFYSEQKQNVIQTKFGDFIKIPLLLKALISSENINLIIGNSPLAGGICYLALKRLSIPLVVECFEPHADSMRESGVWATWDLRYWILKYLEFKQKKVAWKLQVVSSHYANKLTRERVPTQKIKMLANCLSIEDFTFNNHQRSRVRAKLGFSDSAIVSIYVGKFGGIYYDQEAFELFASAFRFFGDSFRLIILTTHDSNEVKNNLSLHGIDASKAFVSSVPHSEVMDYLSASDFAFATIKSTPIRLYCCPVKNGEYWANGLPILLENGIGDDSDIIKREGGGIILNKTRVIDSLKKMKDYLSVGREEQALRIKPIAFNYRRLDLITIYYKDLISQFKSLHLPIAFLVYRLTEISI